MEKLIEEKPLAPRPPKCLCDSWIHWLLGIVSPSKLNFVDSNDARTYREEFIKYQDNFALWKIKNRLMKSKEWKQYYRKQRIPTSSGGTGDTPGQSLLQGFLDGLKNERSEPNEAATEENGV